jgi:hypothetical protein
VQNYQIHAPNFSAHISFVQHFQIGTSNFNTQKQNIHWDPKTDQLKTDQLKTDAQKDVDPNEIRLFQKRLHKAKRTLEDIQKLNIKHWTSLKNSVEKETKTWKKCFIKRNQKPHHLGPSFQCDQY